MVYVMWLAILILPESHEKGTEVDIVVKVLLETVNRGVSAKGWVYIAFHFAAGNARRKKHMSEWVIFAANSAITHTTNSFRWTGEQIWASFAANVIKANALLSIVPMDKSQKNLSMYD